MFEFVYLYVDACGGLWLCVGVWVGLSRHVCVCVCVCVRAYGHVLVGATWCVCVDVPVGVDAHVSVSTHLSVYIRLPCRL